MIHVYLATGEGDEDEQSIDGFEVDGWHTPLREVDVIELRAALDELENKNG